jgi:hypothetical protein
MIRQSETLDAVSSRWNRMSVLGYWVGGAAQKIRKRLAENRTRR